jgi:hypothetical protein
VVDERLQKAALLGEQLVTLAQSMGRDVEPEHAQWSGIAQLVGAGRAVRGACLALGLAAPTLEMVRADFPPALGDDAAEHEPTYPACGCARNAGGDSAADHLVKHHLRTSIALEPGAPTSRQLQVMREAGRVRAALPLELGGDGPLGGSYELGLRRLQRLAAGGGLEAAAATFAGKANAEAQLRAAIELYTGVLEADGGRAALVQMIANLGTNATHEGSLLGDLLRKRIRGAPVSRAWLGVAYCHVVLVREGAECVVRLPPGCWRALCGDKMRVRLRALICGRFPPPGFDKAALDRWVYASTLLKALLEPIEREPVPDEEDRHPTAARRTAREPLRLESPRPRGPDTFGSTPPRNRPRVGTPANFSTQTNYEAGE